MFLVEKDWRKIVFLSSWSAHVICSVLRHLSVMKCIVSSVYSTQQYRKRFGPAETLQLVKYAKKILPYCIMPAPLHLILHLSSGGLLQSMHIHSGKRVRWAIQESLHAYWDKLSKGIVGSQSSVPAKPLNLINMSSNIAFLRISY